MNPVEAATNPAWLYAALSGPFEPKQALASLGSIDDRDRLLMEATRLAEACDTNPAGAEERWLMRTSVRHGLLDSLGRPTLVAAATAQLSQAHDPQTLDLLAVLLDRPPLVRDEIHATIQAADDQAKLERIVVALDQAGEVAPAKDLLQPARAALAELHRRAGRQRVAERGFFGRRTEREQIADWLSRPFNKPPVACLFITGGPGMGKSALLAEAVRLYYEQHRPLVLRLDFDQAGLDVLDQLGLTAEAARQLAEQLGEAGRGLLDARLMASGFSRDPDAIQQKSRGRQLPGRLTAEIGKAVAASGRTVLVVLDTLEVLRGGGETHPDTLFRWLDALLLNGAKPMVVLAAGRGDALENLPRIAPATGQSTGRGPDRVKQLALLGLEQTAAVELLERLQVPSNVQNELIGLAMGNPLKLRLGAEITRRSGADRLIGGRKRPDKEISAAFLYRLLLSRIDDPALKRLAHPGLIVRRINADLIREVLAPKLGLGSITRERADDLLKQLATHHWLVEPDAGAPGFLKHRGDMRALLLPMLYQSAPGRSAQIDAAAIPWFAKLKTPWAQIEAVYHQLQLARRGRAPPSIPAHIADQFDAETLDELPPAVADVVRAARGERSSQFRDSQAAMSTAVPEGNAVVRELLGLLKSRDWVEGAYIVGRITDAGGLDVRTPAADAVRAFLWRSGQWAQARHWLAERDRFDASDADLADLHETLALARLEMRAEFDPDRLRRHWHTWRPLMPKLDQTAVAASDNAARYGALGLLLSELPEPFYFSCTDSRDSDVVAAAREHWIGDSNGRYLPAEQMGRERISRVASATESPAFGLALATLTPYPIFASNLMTLQGRAGLREAVGRAADCIARGSLFEDRYTLLPTMSDDDPIGWLTDLGLFAEWAGASAFVRRDADLRLIARAAERWRRTVAGDWSIGQRRGRWLALPPLDKTLTQRLVDLIRSDDPLRRAQQQLDGWGEALASEEFLSLLRRRLGGVLAKSAGQAVVEEITQTLLSRGAPAAIAPALAVMVKHDQQSQIPESQQ